MPLAGLLFTDDFIAQHQDFIAVLNDDLQAAVEWSKAHPDETTKLAAEYLPFPPEALAAGIEAEILNFYTEMHALNAKITGGKVPDAGLFYRG